MTMTTVYVVMSDTNGHSRLRAKDFADHLLAHGEPVVNLARAASMLELTAKDASIAMLRLRRRGLLFSPARGLYVAVQPQYRTWGAVPALDFIDPLMRALDRSYYVGLLSAAELWGASHQRPQVLQVITDRPVANKDFGRVRVQFYVSARAGAAVTIKRNTATGQAHVSPPARTCLDVCERPLESGGLSNVATVAADLVEQHAIDASAIVQLANDYPSSVLRRLGFVLEAAVDQGASLDIDLDALAIVANPHPSVRPRVELEPGGPRRGKSSRRWGIIVNAPVELDR